MDSYTENMENITTFGLPAQVRVFPIRTEEDIISYFRDINGDFFVLGGGSNIIASESITAKDILKIEIPGIYITRESPEEAYLFAGAGENWDNVVKWAVHKKLSGIEALSSIPGTVGATPVQNVGAYGTEIKDTLISVRAYDITQGKFVELDNMDCEFSYRWSIFKGRDKDKYIITSILLKLTKLPPKMPEYPVVKKYFDEIGIKNPTVSEIRDAIIEIRKSKLPSPDIIPNCGSFFENPIIEEDVAKKLKEKYPHMPQYDMGNSKVKIPAGFLIEESGLKGVQFDHIGTYEKNALVLINLGGAKFEDVLHAKNEIIQRVKDKFGVTLETEPEFI